MTSKKTCCLCFLAILTPSFLLITSCASELVSHGRLQVDCEEYAGRLGMSTEEAWIVEESARGVEVKSGEVQCHFEHDGTLRSIADFRSMSRKGGGAQVVSSLEVALGIMRSALDSMDEHDVSGLLVPPIEEWNDRDLIVYGKVEPDAFGYPTHGFAGRTEIGINKSTGKVAILGRLRERICDPPNIQVNEAEAKRLAEQTLTRVREVPPQVRCKLHLGYFAAFGDGSTPQGDFYRERNRARLCWYASFYIPSRIEGTPGTPFGGVSVDSETGELLSVDL